jgi:hypothetical protein
MQWMKHMQWSDFFINGLICALCEAFLIRRCWKVCDTSRWVYFALANDCILYPVHQQEHLCSIAAVCFGCLAAHGKYILGVFFDRVHNGTYFDYFQFAGCWCSESGEEDQARRKCKLSVIRLLTVPENRYHHQTLQTSRQLYPAVGSQVMRRHMRLTDVV